MILSLRKRRIRCPTRSKHRLYLPFVRQNAGGFRKAPSTFEGGALRRAVPAPLSGPRGLRCRGKCPGERPYTTAPLSFGQCPLPCPAQEACVAGESTPGLFLDFPPSPRAGGGRAVPAASSGQSFCAAHSTMPRGSFPVFSSSPWPDLPAGARLLASFWQKKEESPSLYAL